MAKAHEEGLSPVLEAYGDLLEATEIYPAMPVARRRPAPWRS